MKKAVKALAVLLAAIFCFSALVVIVGATAGEAAQSGDKFYFGTYPQTRVTDRDLMIRLDTIAATTKKDTITLEGVTYQGARIAESSNPGEGPFAMMYGYMPNRTYWFRCEPIVWRVLDSDADSVLLLSEYVISARTFNNSIREDNTWENSDIRAWLNGAFLRSAFSEKEQAFLLESALTNEDNPVHGSYNGVPSSYKGDVYNGYPYCGTESGNDTTDTVFLPSFNEITNKDYGFNVYCDTYGDFGEYVGYYEEGGFSGRQTYGTDYAKCQGLWSHLTAEDGMPMATCFYWLRTAGYENGYAAGVLPDGRVSTGWLVDYDVLGVRPMIRVSPDAVADASNPFTDPEDETLPFHIIAPATEFHYRQRDVQFSADTDVTWTSSDPKIATIDETGMVTIRGVGTVTITATSKETGETIEFQMEITYLWWQQLIRIFLFGWIWY